MNSMKEAFEDLIKDIHNAEKQIEKALPKLIKKCSDERLKQAFEQHLEETKEQAKRVEQVAKQCGFKHTGMVCKGMQGIIQENEEHMKEGKPGPVLDAVIIAGAQKVEHYEICAYGTARAWAEQLGFNEVVGVLDEILKQESATDEKLNELAMNQVNAEALRQPEEPASSNGKSRSKSATSRSKTSSGSKSSPRGKVSVR